jgi:hypothetical protein
MIRVQRCLATDAIGRLGQAFEPPIRHAEPVGHLARKHAHLPCNDQAYADHQHAGDQNTQNIHDQSFEGTCPSSRHKDCKNTASRAAAALSWIT